MNEKITPHKWSIDETDKLIKLYPETKNSDIAFELKKSIGSIIFMATKLKLRKTKSFKSRMISKRNKVVGRDLTFDILKQIASKYKSRGEFLTKDPSAYTTARIAGYLPEICQHMSVVEFSIPQLILKDIMDNLLQLSSLYNTRKIIPPYEIDIFYPSLNLALEYNGKGWHKNNTRDLIKYKMFEEKNINVIYINERSRRYEEDIKNQIIENINKINKMCNTNLTNKNVMDYKIRNVYQIIYNKEDLLNIAKKYSSFKIFKNKEKSVYVKLCKMKLINEATNHMSDKRRKHTISEVKSIIKNYKTLKNFIHDEFPIYQYIHRNKLWNLINNLQSNHRWKSTSIF